MGTQTPHASFPLCTHLTAQCAVPSSNIFCPIPSILSIMEKERPFSFLAREQDRLMQREEAIQAAKDPNRFQVGEREGDGASGGGQVRMGGCGRRGRCVL